MKLSTAAEEVALFFAQMLDHEYTTKDVFRNNFFRDWRKVRDGVSPGLQEVARLDFGWGSWLWALKPHAPYHKNTKVSCFMLTSTLKLNHISKVSTCGRSYSYSRETSIDWVALLAISL